MGVVPENVIQAERDKSSGELAGPVPLIYSVLVVRHALTALTFASSFPTLTLKGPLRAGEFRSREELEIEISSPETAGNILKTLGFVSILTYQKRRESWSLGECRIELDEPPHIGLFVEIEGSSESAIRSARSDLGLDRVGNIAESYVRMLLDYCIEHGITDRTLGLPVP